MGKRINPESLVGKKFNKLTIVKHLGMRPTCTYTKKQTGKKQIMTTRYYLYRCECGREKETTLYNIRKQKGCIHCGNKKTNPRTRHPLYKYWARMRCYNYRKSGRDYILRDKYRIQVCDRWLTNFDAFVKDVDEPPTPEHVLGRIDKSKDFTPENYKWMTRKEKGNSSTYFNELTLTNLSKQVGISKERVRQITNKAIDNEEDKLNNLIERIDYINTYKRIVFKPEAIEYFKKKKYFPQIKYIHKLEVIVKQYYLRGTDVETVAEELNKPITSIKRYYKKFASAVSHR
jgi:hypothetical protein